jgi:hypothetical protein
VIFFFQDDRIDWYHRPMDNDVVIMAACDQRYFPYCADLIASIKAAYGFVPRMRVLDLGMQPRQAAELAQTVEKVIEPDWDVGEGMNLPSWYRAMTARPFLPKYAGDAAIIAWIDTDAWVQRSQPVETLINAARDGRLAIVEERFGEGWFVDRITDGPSGRGVMRATSSAESVKNNIRNCYQRCFGSDVADALGELPSLNTGVFALRADSPSWVAWQQTIGPGLANFYHPLVEQQSLNVAVRQGRIPVSLQSLEANFTCHLELPWFCAESGSFTMPQLQARHLGVIHLTDTKDFPLLLIPHFPHGEVRPLPLLYRSFQKVLKGEVTPGKILSEMSQPPRIPNLDLTNPANWGKGCHGQAI